jgi:class 3 adenylate cyclase
VVTCVLCGHANRDGAKFCEQCGAPLGAPPRGQTRKVVTALFCDLVGSTSLGERHDPEVVGPVLERYYRSMRAVLERHGGRVEKFIGDAVAAVFGVPVAHEDDALRAVRAGLEMLERLESLDRVSPIRLAARVGITTGEVIVEGDAAPVVGDAVNTAARLQSAAAPSEILIGAPTWHLVRDAVAADPITPVAAKGKARPVEAWRVVALRPSGAASAMPFLGRDRPMRMLVDAVADAVEARASVLVTVLAPPGVGKSRLASAFTEAVADRAQVLVAQTPSYGEGVTFAPLLELLAQAAGQSSADREVVAAELRRRLAGRPDGASVADRLAQVLGVADAVGADASWAVRRLLETLAAERPVVVILDDLHWAEPPMLDLAEAIIDRVHGPVLFLCLARPELLERRPTWAAGRPRAFTATLPPLSREHTRQIGSILLGPDAPAAVVERVCETAEGNPLYLQHLTAMLRDQGMLVAGRWIGSDEAELEIPASLHALLSARIDRLDPSPRSLLERASVQGRRFRVAPLRALAGEHGRGGVEAALIELERSGLVECEDEPAGRWRFGHALVAEAAYRRLAKATRSQLHEELADWIAAEDADQADVDEAAARHLERAVALRDELGLRDESGAELARRAGTLFAAAGSRAFAGVDLTTSRDLLGRAVALLPASDARRLEILPDLGVALTETGRPDEAAALLTEAIELARAAGAERSALRATIQLLSNRVYRSPTESEIDQAVAEAERVAAAFEALEDDAGLAEAAIALEYLEFTRGRIARTHEWARRAVTHGLAAGRAREATQGASDVVQTAAVGPMPFAALGALADAFVAAGDPISGSIAYALTALASLAAGDAARFADDERRWREFVDRHGLAWLGAAHGLVIAGVEISAGDAESARQRLDEARDVLVALGDVWWIETLDNLACAAAAAAGDQHRFLRLVDTLDALPVVPDRQLLTRRSVLRARALLLRGLLADAEAAAQRAVDLADATDLVADHAEALLVLAECLDKRGLDERAAAERARARELLRAKGNLAALARLDAEPAGAHVS